MASALLDICLSLTTGTSEWSAGNDSFLLTKTRAIIGAFEATFSLQEKHFIHIGEAGQLVEADVVLAGKKIRPGGTQEIHCN